MPTRHWQLLLHKDRIATTLFTTTSDQMVQQDLRLRPEDSLICQARQYHRRAQTDEQNHRDLAIGALMTYATEPLYDRDDAHIEQVEEVPAREPNRFVGGSARAGLVPVWEEPSAYDDR